jgi:hypothetical protein
MRDKVKIDNGVKVVCSCSPDVDVLADTMLSVQMSRLKDENARLKNEIKILKQNRIGIMPKKCKEG